MADIEEIKSRLNIVDVLSEYIRVEKAGSNHRALCPFHNEKSPSFMISEEKQFWHCFGCQKSGDIFSFVMEMEGLEFKEALKMLAEKAGVELKDYNPKKTEEKNRTLEILELATKFYEIQLWKGAGKEKILGYLRERGLKDETIRDFRLGYAPRGWRNMQSFLVARGYGLDEIKKTGLLVTQIKNSTCYDRFRDRIMFPIADSNGKIVGYSARVAPGGDESQAKYVNTPETEVYHKSKILYGIDKAKSEIKKNRFVLLVEGNMDVIAASQSGIKNTVAVSGTALTEDQIGILKRYTDTIKMFFDMDTAGQMATKKSLKLCFSQDVSVWVVDLPFGKDAADLAKDNPEELVRSVENSILAMEYIFEKNFSRYDSKSVDGKRKIVKEVMDVLVHVASDIERSHWMKKLSQDLDVPESALTDILKKANLKDRIEQNGESVAEEIVPKSKIEFMEEELIGLLLVSKEAWKKFLSSHASFLDDNFFPKDGLFQKLISKGAEAEFDFLKFCQLVTPEEKSRAEKIYFEKKYRLDLNNNPEEVIISSPVSELEKIMREIRKEKTKESLSRITHDLKAAEEKKDREKILLLRQEFKKNQDELIKLQ